MTRIGSRWCTRGAIALFFVPLLLFAQRDALLAEGDRLLSAGQIDAALTAYTRALEGGSDFSHDALHARNLGRCYLSAAHPDYGQAVRWLKQSLAADPTADDTRAWLARAQSAVGAYDDAARTYRALADAHPEDPDYILSCARALRQAGKPDAALEAIRASLDRNPHLTAVRVEYARQLSYQRQLEEARRQFLLALRLEPDNLGAQVGLAKVTSWQGDQRGALEQYERILAGHPGLYDALVGKAFSLLWMGRSEEAKPLLESAARRHPEDDDVREALRSLGITIAAPLVRSEMPRERPLMPVLPAGSARRQTRLTAPQPRPATASKSPPARAPASRIPPVREVTSPAANRPAAAAAPAIVMPPWWYDLRWRDLATIGAVTLIMIWVAGVLVSYRVSARRRARIAALSQSAPPRPYNWTAVPPLMTDPAPSEMEAAAADEWPQITAEATEPESPAPTPAESRPAPPARAAEPVLRGLRVIIVGSSPAVLQIEQRVLAAASAAVSAFDSWQTAMDFADALPPDLLVINPMTVDGWTAATAFTWLRSNKPSLLRRTLLTLSVHDDTTDAICSELGGACLYHPFGPTEFLDAAVQVLHGNSAASAAAG